MGDKKVLCNMAEITECLWSYGDDPGQKESLWTRGRTIAGAGHGDGIPSRAGAENTSPTALEGGVGWAPLKAVGDICKVSSNCFCFEVK